MNEKTSFEYGEIAATIYFSHPTDFGYANQLEAMQNLVPLALEQLERAIADGNREKVQELRGFLHHCD